MFLTNWTAKSQVIAPSWSTHVAGLVGVWQAGKPNVFVAARLAFAGQVTSATGSYTVSPPGFTCNPLPVAAGVPGILPGIIGSTYRKLGAVLAPWNPLLKEKLAYPDEPRLDCDQ